LSVEGALRGFIQDLNSGGLNPLRSKFEFCMSKLLQSFVSGHGFSRAIKVEKMDPASAAGQKPRTKSQKLLTPLRSNSASFKT
jgi:hypothetical protein